MKRLILLFLIVFNANSCITKRSPPPKEEVKVEEISFDGNEKNGGIIDFIKDKGWLLTNHAADRYTELTKKYGDMFLPPLKKGQGLIKEDDHYILSQEYIIKFAQMNQRWKLERK